MKIKIIIFSLILLLCFVYCYSLEVTDGRIRLVLHENIGRFSLYYLNDPVKNKYTSFILDQDVRTSVISVVVDNRIYRLGESGSFKETAEQTKDGARFTWESRQLKITEDFSFIASPESHETDAVLVTLILKNISDKSIKIGVRYLFDTYLGESHNHHFKTNLTDNVTNETVIEKKDMISYWISQNIKSENVGLQVVTGTSGVSAPDKIVFGNWKRLNETTWTFLSSGKRDFSSRPYSINDSAVCHYYNPVSVQSGASRKIILIMGNINTRGYENADTALEETYAALKLGSRGNRWDQIKSDVKILKNLLKVINKKIESGELITDKDISIMEQIIREIKSRIEKYETE